MKMKKERVQGYVSTSLKETIKKFSAKNNMTESELVTEALNQYFKVKTVNDNLDFIVSIIENTIHKELDSKLNRIISLDVKATKSALSSQFLQILVLSAFFDRENDREFIKEKLKLAEQIGYKATKLPISESIESVLPNDLDKFL